LSLPSPSSAVQPPVASSTAPLRGLLLEARASPRASLLSPALSLPLPVPPVAEGEKAFAARISLLDGGGGGDAARGPLLSLLLAAASTAASTPPAQRPVSLASAAASTARPSVASSAAFVFI
jgi:hypothetical protein